MPADQPPPLTPPGTTQRKATTFRLDPQLQEGLELIGRLTRKPLNRLINEAVRGYIETRSVAMESDLIQILERVRACRGTDPKFETAIAAIADAEASLGSDDPAEGRTHFPAGPAQTMLHELLRD